MTLVVGATGLLAQEINRGPVLVLAARVVDLVLSADVAKLVKFQPQRMGPAHVKIVVDTEVEPIDVTAYAVDRWVIPEPVRTSSISSTTPEGRDLPNPFS